MQISATGRKLIESCEGCKLEAYQDLGGVWTVGYGHTNAAGAPAVHPEMTVSAEQADQILSHDLLIFGAGVNAALRKEPTQPEFDAMVSLAYNIGLSNFRSSSVLLYFNRGAVPEAADAFLLWEYSDGRKIDGLVARRNRERFLFLQVDYAPITRPMAYPMVHAIDHPDGLLTRLLARISAALP